jgi:hypothetical protein
VRLLGGHYPRSFFFSLFPLLLSNSGLVNTYLPIESIIHVYGYCDNLRYANAANFLEKSGGNHMGFLIIIDIKGISDKKRLYSRICAIE